VMTLQVPEGERVMNPAVAATLRAALSDVVENGTGRRANGVFHAADGTALVVGGKTGTGDHRFERFGSNGHVIESQVMNRTATFVFYLGDRFFGVLSAHVAGADAVGCDFTSALPTQLLKSRDPRLQPLLDHAPPSATPPSATPPSATPPLPEPQMITEDHDLTVLGDASAPCEALQDNRWHCALAGAVQSAAR